MLNVCVGKLETLLHPLSLALLTNFLGTVGWVGATTGVVLVRTLVCRGGVQGDLRQWSYAASESYAEVENKQDGRVISARRIRTVTRLLTHQVHVPVLVS